MRGKSLKSTLIITVSIITSILVIVLAATGINQIARQSMIHNRGSQVMPFKLDATKHIFKQTSEGGIQQVVVINPKDSDQIDMIREHLRMEAQKFSKGDYSDPSSLHGKNMPGLYALEKGSANINITYSDLPDGGQIVYSTSDIKLIKAIHNWFEAQLSDHGKDAMSM